MVVLFLATTKFNSELDVNQTNRAWLCKKDYVKHACYNLVKNYRFHKKVKVLKNSSLVVLFLATTKFDLEIDVNQANQAWLCKKKMLKINMHAKTW